ncbi:indole-3-glycerol phosphate synthase TrpC [Paenibacillus sediminis]|uniref:Indole-3-glycerol phosphate synthase n=1 Tax=Paenibacillus sediminis TaxID=664909 RepID=A0ABS4H0X3_9BACL|nr:indole-3-glycerol phosphate synthase TrpC [Paenibacillus sediminis]MBP1935770.1 indole-3-glycerol phosphate synthase [Paenibacillus sediminis]
MYLDRIVVTKKQEAEHLAAHFSLDRAEKTIAEMAPTLGFEAALASGRKRKMGLIAEVKKASPSKGLIRPDFNPVAIAKAYEAAGTDCISVLTDSTYFQGSGQYLQEIRNTVGVPLLRKDFIIDERQIYEARLLGADAILLIASILDAREIKQFLHTAKSLGLDALVEVHNREELEKVLDLGIATLIGVNNRDLHTFETRLETTEILADLVPKEITLISESGISGPQDIAYLQSIGAHGVLVGEYFMRKPVVEDAVIDLMGPISEGSPMK